MNQYREFEKVLENIEIPPELDDRILQSIKRGKRKMRTEKNKRSVLAVVAGLAIVFTFTVNTMPGLATTFDRIPGLSYLAEIVKFDKGLKSAVDHGYVQQSDMKAEDQDVEVSIGGAITDTDRINFIYSIKMGEKYEGYTGVVLWELSVTDETGNKPDWFVGNMNQTDRNNFIETNTASGVIELIKNDFNSTQPQKICIKITKLQGLKYTEEVERRFSDGSITSPEEMRQIVEANEIVIEGLWEFEIPLDQLRSIQPLTYNLNHKPPLDGVDVTVNQIRIFPTNIIANMQFDSSGHPYGKYTIIHFQLEDENGTIYHLNRDKMNFETGEYTAYFESCYYAKPQQLFLVGTGEYYDTNADKVNYEEILRIRVDQ